jgi:DNA polymerase III epsilon subunit-like protein
MPLNKNILIVIDMETSSLDVATLQPLQIAAVVVDPRSLELGDTFSSLMKPLDFNNLDPQAMAVNKIKIEDLEKAPDQKVIWQRFAYFVKQYNRGHGPHGAPIACGKNIRLFDLPICNRLCRTYENVDKEGVPNLFHRRTILDLEDILWWWFESSEDLPNYAMDTCREFFGLSTVGAHDALTDARQTAEMLVKFLKLHRHLKNKRLDNGQPMIRFRPQGAADMRPRHYRKSRKS